jgi:hypothetical protein
MEALWRSRSRTCLVVDLARADAPARDGPRVRDALAKGIAIDLRARV